MILLLKRFGYTDNGVFGALCEENGRPFLTTLERPWQMNLQNVSCIPVGEYECARVVTPKHGECFEVQGVPMRGSILIHAGNTIADSQGCILLGKEYDTDRYAILYSKIAVEIFMAKLQGTDKFTLKIS